jgi:hypothetical protein
MLKLSDKIDKLRDLIYSHRVRAHANKPACMPTANTPKKAMFEPLGAEQPIAQKLLIPHNLLITHNKDCTD